MLAFEPTPATSAFLRHNVAAFANVECFECAVGDNNDDIEFLDFGAARAAFNSTVGLRDANPAKGNEKVERLIVVQTTLDEIYRRTNAPPDYIKIDVESAESAVLAGMVEIMAKFRPTIALELGDFAHLQNTGVPSSRQLIDLLGRYNYRPYEFRDGCLTPHRILRTDRIPI